jgi:hypothetical protein
MNSRVSARMRESDSRYDFLKKGNYVRGEFY